MRKSWIHPEYRFVLEGNLAGLAYASEALRSHDNGEEQVGKQLCLRSPWVFALFLMIICVVSMLVAQVMFTSLQGGSLISAAQSVEQGVPGVFRSAVVAGYQDRVSFLKSLFADKESQVAGHAHYISELIRISGVRLNDKEKQLAVAIVEESLDAGYDPLLVAAVIKSESMFNNLAVSNKSAKGLMQIQPETGKFIAKLLNVNWGDCSKLSDPRFNIKLGIAYLKYLEKTFGNLEHALVAYNWGPGNLSSALKRGGRIPSSTLTYAQKIMSTHVSWRKELDTRMAAYRFLDAGSMLG